MNRTCAEPDIFSSDNKETLKDLILSRSAPLGLKLGRRVLISPPQTAYTALQHQRCER
jgi:hypothetical protein